MKFQSLFLLLFFFLLLPKSSGAYLSIQNNSKDTIFQSGDVIRVELEFPDEYGLKEIRFRSATKTYYIGRPGNSGVPFFLYPNWSRKTVEHWDVFFTVPSDFASNDTNFFFSAELTNGGPMELGWEEIMVRGIPNAITPTNDKKVFEFVRFDWHNVLGATSYQVQVKQEINDSTLTTVLDTTLTSHSMGFPMSIVGNYQWTIRALIDSSWRDWVATAYFIVDETASVPQKTSNEEKILLYPQPSFDVINIESRVGEVKRVEVYDVAGNHIMTEGNLIASLRSFNVKHLSPGLYHVKLMLNEGELMLPFIKR